jgi:DNA-binding CsgD family transcriptional regulator
MAGHAHADIEQRRSSVAQLWLRGLSLRQIAKAVGTDHMTVSRDIRAVRADLVAQHRQEFESARARSIAHLREVQASAWQLHVRLTDDRTNKVASLQTIVSAEMLIAKLEGTLGPDNVNVSAVQVRVANDALERAAADPEVAVMARQLLTRVAGGGAAAGGASVGGEPRTVDARPARPGAE